MNSKIDSSVSYPLLLFPPHFAYQVFHIHHCRYYYDYDYFIYLHCSSTRSPSLGCTRWCTNTEQTDVLFIMHPVSIRRKRNVHIAKEKGWWREEAYWILWNILKLRSHIIREAWHGLEWWVLCSWSWQNILWLLHISFCSLVNIAFMTHY